jgi:hypothetical protein
VYVVVIAGVTVTEAPVKLPGIHAYVDVPDAVSVAEFPTQIAGIEADAVTVG